MNIVIEGSAVYRVTDVGSIIEKVYMGELSYVHANMLGQSTIQYTTMIFNQVTQEYEIDTKLKEIYVAGKSLTLVNGVATTEIIIPDPLTVEQVNQNITETKTVVMSTEGTVMMTSEDALTIMEYQTVLDEKLSKIITHLGL